MYSHVCELGTLDVMSLLFYISREANHLLDLGKKGRIIGMSKDALLWQHIE
jgi:hypothetical protein